MFRLVVVAMFATAVLPAGAQTYFQDIRTCDNGVAIDTVWMAKPNSTRYAMSMVITNWGTQQADADAFVTKWLVPKFNDPTVPSADSQGYGIHENRINWIVLGKSPLGYGCGAP
jgi:hypothetical protein